MTLFKGNNRKYFSYSNMCQIQKTWSTYIYTYIYCTCIYTLYTHIPGGGGGASCRSCACESVMWIFPCEEEDCIWVDYLCVYRYICRIYGVYDADLPVRKLTVVVCCLCQDNFIYIYIYIYIFKNTWIMPDVWGRIKHVTILNRPIYVHTIALKTCLVTASTRCWKIGYQCFLWIWRICMCVYKYIYYTSGWGYVWTCLGPVSMRWGISGEPCLWSWGCIMTAGMYWCCCGVWGWTMCTRWGLGL